jgi:hypothetical protein
MNRLAANPNRRDAMKHITAHQRQRIQELLTLHHREEASLLSEYAPDCTALAEVDRAVAWHMIDELTKGTCDAPHEC